MFNKEQLQRFSIRKLTVGAASVLIGVLFLTSWNTNTVYADSINVTSGESIAKNNNPQEGNPAVNKDNVQIVDNDSTEVSNISDSKSSKVIKSDATKSDATESDIVRDKKTIDGNSGTTELTAQANNKQALTTVTEDNGAKVSKTEKYSNSDIKKQPKNSEKTQETTLVKKVLDKEKLSSESLIEENLSSESLIDPEKLDRKVEIPATDPSNTIPASDPITYPEELNGLINKDGKDKYIYQVLSLDGGSKLILSVNRNDHTDKRIYAYVTDGNYKKVKQSETIDRDQQSIITINGREYQLNNNGSSEVSIKNGKKVSTQNSSTVTSAPGYYTSEGGYDDFFGFHHPKYNIYHKYSNVNPIKQSYGLGSTTSNNCSAIGEIVPVFTKNSVIKYYYRDNEGHLQEFKNVTKYYYRDNEGHLQEFKNSELPNVSVEGFTGQKFEIDNVAKYKRVVIPGYHLISDNIPKNLPKGNFNGTLSQFSDGKYYKKVYYNFDTNTVEYSVLYHQVSPDGTMEVCLLDDNDHPLTGSRRVIAPGTSTPPFELDISYGEHTTVHNITVRNPYVTAAPHEVQLIYSPNAQTAKITYIDDTTKNNLDSKDANGKFGQAITFATAPTDEIANYEKQGYVLVSNSFNNQTYAADNNNNVFYVHLKHKTESVTRNDTVTRTIHYLYDNGNTAQPDKTQTVSFDETGTKDDVTGDTTWNNDSAQTVDSVITPSIVGYTPDKSSIEKQSFKFGDQDVEVTVTYHANAQTAKITYIDDTTKNNLDSKDANGKFGQAITFATAPTDEIANYEKQGYVLVSNSFDNNKYQADNNNNVFYVHFIHGTKKVNREHSASFTVHYIYKDGGQAKPDHEQTLSFTENGSQDLVTQKITWTPAGSQKFDDVTTPVITGYTPDHDKVIGQTANFETDNREVTVTYLPNVQLGHINYIDDNTGKTLTHDNFSGRTNEHEDYTPNDRIQEFENKGYVFVSSDYPDGGFNFDDNDQQDQVFNVHLKHGIVTVTSKKPQTPNMPIDPDPHSPKYPKDISNTNSDVKRTIDYKFKDGKTAQPTVNDSLHFERTVVIDKVTGDVLSDIWTPSQDFNDVQTPVIQGYTPDRTVVSDTNIGHDHQNIIEHVIYSPDAQHMTITYVDDTTHETLKQDKLDGTSDQDAKYTTGNSIKHYADLHYKLVSDSTNGQDLIFDHDDNANQTYEVHFVHGTHTINQTTSPKQTIHYVYADGLARQGKASDDNVQQLSFKRDGYNDEVTGTDHWNAWTPANSNYSAVDSPVVQGYTPDKPVIEKSTVNPTDKDTEITVVYNADKQAAHVIYVDKTTNTTLTSDDLSGQSDKDSGYNTKDTIGKYQSQHYVLTGDETDGKNVIFDHDDKQNQTYYVYFVHDTQKVNRQDTVTSTIDYKFEDGKTAQPTVIQTKHFSEDGVKDLVTGKIAWTPAKSQKFDDIATKSIVGYTPDKDNVAGSTVKFGDKDIEVTVTYHNNAQTAKITYVDDVTKKTLASDSQDGKFDHEIAFSHKPSDVISGFEKAGYKLVSNNFKDGTKYKADDKQNEFIVHLTHDKQKVNRQDQVIETIHYVYENGSKSQPDHEQTISFTEDGIKDKVTGQIAWTPADSQKFDDVATPVITGYTPDKGNVTGSTVKFGDKDIEVTVTYHNNAQTAKITYVDDVTKKTLASDSQDGKFDHEIAFSHKPSDVISGFEKAGYKLVSNNFKDGTKYKADDKQNEFIVHLTHDKQKVNRQDQVIETIHYVYENGSKSQPDHEQTISFTEDGIKDKVTGQIAWTPADSQKFDDVATPVITGYTPDKGNVTGSTVKFGDKDIEVTVTYHNNAQKAVITYIDDVTKKTLASDSQAGKFDHEIAFSHKPSDVISGFEKAGYKLVSNNFKDGTKYKADDKQNEFIVHLTHDKQKVNRQNQVIETINYKFEDGKTAQPTVTQTKHFSEDGVKDLVTGKIAWDEAKPQKFDDVATPAISGYTPDKGNVTGSTVKFGDKDIEVTVTYHNNAQTAKIIYIDDTEKKTLGSDKQNGKFNQAIIFEHDPAEVIKGLEEKGYKLVSDNFKPGIKYQNDNKFNIFEVHLVHTYEPVETSQTITETVHYIDANGKPVAPDHVAKVVIKVTGTRDKVTDSITWNTPSTGHFDEVISPEVPNMTPDKKLIPGRDVQYGDSDITESVVYTPDNSTSKTPEKPDKPSKEVSKTPEKPNKPSKEVSKIPEKPNKSSKEVSKAPEKSIDSQKSIDSRTVDNHVSAKSTAKRELPQTGATTNTGIWTGLVSMIASLGLLGASKKRKKN